MSGAEPMTVPQSGIQYAQPLSWVEPGGYFLLAASACVVMPITAQTTAVIAIIRAIAMFAPLGWPASDEIEIDVKMGPLSSPRSAAPVSYPVPETVPEIGANISTVNCDLRWAPNSVASELV